MFWGWRKLRLYDLLPEIYKDKDTEKLFDILQIAIDDLESSAEDVKNLYDIDKVREDFLTYLASNLGVNLDRHSILGTREKISKVVDLYKLKGTKKGIELALNLLTENVIIKEWFEYGGEPYKFKVDLSLSNKEITTAIKDKLINLINEYKNERSWLEEIALSYFTKAFCYVSAKNMAEAAGYSEMIDGFTWISQAVGYVSAGVLGEATAVAIAMEV